jgi:hypothetical protein
MDLHVVLPGHPQHEGAQRLGQHMHAVDRKLHELLFEKILPTLLDRPRMAHRRLTGIVADAEGIGAKLEVAENIAAGGVIAAATRLLHPAIDLADDIGMRHPRVFENHLAVLIEAPTALVEHLADAEAGRVARHQK